MKPERLEALRPQPFLNFNLNLIPLRMQNINPAGRAHPDGRGQVLGGQTNNYGATALTRRNALVLPVLTVAS